MDTNETDPIINTQVPDQASEVKTEDQQKYQQVLDEYSPPLPPTPPPPVNPPPAPPKPPQQKFKKATSIQKPPPPKKQFNLFKYLFYISVIVFLALVGLLVKDYLTLQQVSTNNLSSPTNIPTQTDSACSLNDIIYQIGDTVPSQDDCNTCTCLDDDTGPHIICTQKDCSQTTPGL